MAARQYPSPTFLLQASWPGGQRAFVVSAKCEPSPAPGASVWLPFDVLETPMPIEIRGVDRPSLFIGGRDRGSRYIFGAGVELAVERLPLDAHPDPNIGSLVGSSLVMRRLFRQIDDARRSDLPVLIRGETGTGKELVARTVHDGSARRERPYLVIDCAAITESLLESELFGHVRGAFSGATSARVGAFEAASGGTVFIDEVGELPPVMQPKLLRVLESGSFRRVGENHHREANVRIIAATHRDLRAMVAAGTFREDLYYRLAVLEAWVPPLRNRFGDLPDLIRSFVPAHVLASVSQAQWEAIELHQWRGNVRELRNFVQRAALRGWEGLFDPAEQQSPPQSSRALPSLSEMVSQPRLPVAGASTQESPGAFRGAEACAALAFNEYRPGETLPEFRARWSEAGEAGYLEAVLRAEGGSVVRAARRASVDRTHFHRLLRRHNLAKASERASLVDLGELSSDDDPPSSTSVSGALKRR